MLHFKSLFLQHLALHVEAHISRLVIIARGSISGSLLLLKVSDDSVVECGVRHDTAAEDFDRGPLRWWSAKCTSEAEIFLELTVDRDRCDIWSPSIRGIRAMVMPMTRRPTPKRKES